MNSLLTRLVPGLLVAVFVTDVRAATIELRADASVSSSQLVLGDVAHVRAADAESTERLANTLLGPAPGPGRRMVVDVSAVRNRLRALRFDVATIEFVGRSRVVVTGEVARPTPTTRPSPRDEVPDWQVRRAEQILERELERHLQHRAPDLGLVHVEVRVPAADAPAVVEARVGGYQFTGGGPDWNEPQSLGVRYLDRDQRVRQSKVEVRVAPLPQVFVARHDLSRGHVVRADDLVRQQVPKGDDGITDLRLLVGRETTRTLREGTVVSPDHVRAVPLVRSNDVVTIVSRSGGVAVKSYGRARRDGGLDDVVPVRTIDNRETLSARVIGYHEVEVALPGSAPPTRTPGRSAVTRLPNFRFESEPTSPTRRRSPVASTPTTAPGGGVVPASHGEPARRRPAAVPPRANAPRVSANPTANRSSAYSRSR